MIPPDFNNGEKFFAQITCLRITYKLQNIQALAHFIGFIGLDLGQMIGWANLAALFYFSENS